MSYSDQTRQAGVEAAHALVRDGELLAGLGLKLAVALVLGARIARTAHRRGIHWSWSACALAPTLMLRPLLGTLAPLLLAGLGRAAVRGRRLHRDSLDAGRDLAAAARVRRTPVDAIRLAAVRLIDSGAATGIRSLAAAGRDRGERLRLGRERDGRGVSVPFAPGSSGHTLVVGATGSGKTVTQTLMAVRAVEAGQAAIVVDPKGDAGMREQLRQAASRGGRALIEWTPAGPSVYNPYGHGGETEIADRLLAGERFTEPHYMRQAQRYLGHVVRTLRAGAVEVSLRTIVDLLDPQALEALLRDMPEEQARVGHAYLDSLTPRQLRDLAGVRDRLAILAESEVGRWLDPAGCQQFNLLDAVRAGAVVHFSLESDSRPLLAEMLGAAIVQDLQSTIAALQGSPVATTVVIDEFSAVSAEHVVALFGRARSAGFSLLLGTQEISDLRLPGRERILEQVMGNLSLLIAHRQVVPASAELVCKLGGTRGAWRVTWGRGGARTRTRSEEPRLPAELLMGLTPGWAAVISFGAGRGARLARIVPAGGER
jgi:Type IV secretion-system coupling protein DNA-binding domain